MFKLFGKKKEEPVQDRPVQESAQSRHPEAAALAAQFGTEEFDIMAVTGANGFGGGKEPGAEFWTASLPLTAWREGDGPIHREAAVLVSLADDKLLDYLRRLAPRDSIIQAKVRQGLEDDRFLLVGLPAPVMDPELKAILDEQTKPVSVWVPDLGTFVLNRSVNWFQTEVEWLGQSIQLTYDNLPEEEAKGAQDTALTLMAAQESWDRRVKEFAAQQLVSLANDWAQEGSQEGEDPETIDPAQFAARLELESIQTAPAGRFEFWFNDGDLFWGHAIRVSGDLEQGPQEAQMEG